MQTRCDEQAVRAGVATAEKTAGPIGILVNNAGLQHRAPLLDFPAAAWQDLIAVNLTGPFLLGREPPAWQRAWGVPADLTGALIFLASAASDFVNGQIIYVDGGMSSVL